jgi:hypothetical protein
MDSPFFRSYVKDRTTLDRILADVRPRLSGDVEIVRHEAHGDGSFEYVVQCGARARCLVYLFEAEGKLVEADVAVTER